MIKLFALRPDLLGIIGGIQVESEPGYGTTFVIKLPVGQ
jgi:chemotaxis protein histidine kinase CheA